MDFSLTPTGECDNTDTNAIKLDFTSIQSRHSDHIEINNSKSGKNYAAKLNSKSGFTFCPGTESRSYFDAVFRHKDPRLLVCKFANGENNLTESDAYGKTFEYSDCYKAVSAGFKLYQVDYNSLLLRSIALKLAGNRVIVAQRNRKRISYSLKNLRGVLFNQSTSTFRRFFDSEGIRDITQNPKLEYFSLITNSHSIDLITDSATIKYSIIIVLTMLISQHSKEPACYPILKSNPYSESIAVIRVRDKLRELCRDYYLSLSELFTV